MAYGITWSISMSTFVDGLASLELPLSRVYILPNPLIFLLFGPLINLQVPFISF
jgi:hypothetical protein